MRFAAHVRNGFVTDTGNKRSVTPVYDAEHGRAVRGGSRRGHVDQVP